jgi:transposase
MSEAGLDSADAPTTDRAGNRRQRIEVITRGERRRSWTAEQKWEIAAESLEPGTSAITVARKHGISSGQLYTWRQQLLRNAVGSAANAPPGFVRVDVVPTLARQDSAIPKLPEPTMAAAPIEPPPAPPVAQPDGRIEIMLSLGVSVRVDAKVDGAALRRVLAALERR